MKDFSLSLPFSAVTGQNSPHIILNIRIAVNDSVKPRTHAQQYMLCSHALLAWNRVTNLKNIALLADSGQSLLDVLWQSFLWSSRSFGVSSQFLFKMNYIVVLKVFLSLWYLFCFFKPTTYSKSLLTLYWKFLLTARRKFNTWNHLWIYLFFSFFNLELILILSWNNEGIGLTWPWSCLSVNCPIPFKPQRPVYKNRCNF